MLKLFVSRFEIGDPIICAIKEDNRKGQNNKKETFFHMKEI